MVRGHRADFVAPRGGFRFRFSNRGEHFQSAVHPSYIRPSICDIRARESPVRLPGGSECGNAGCESGPADKDANGVIFQILGPMLITGEAAARFIPGTKPRQLLGLLLLHANRFVSTDHMADSLWDGEPPGSAGANLRSYIRKLRTTLQAARRRRDDRDPTRWVRAHGGHRRRRHVPGRGDAVGDPAPDHRRRLPQRAGAAGHRPRSVARLAAGGRAGVPVLAAAADPLGPDPGRDAGGRDRAADRARGSPARGATGPGGPGPGPVQRRPVVPAAAVPPRRRPAELRPLGGAGGRDAVRRGAGRRAGRGVPGLGRPGPIDADPADGPGAAAGLGRLPVRRRRARRPAAGERAGRAGRTHGRRGRTGRWPARRRTRT